jgi:PQQ-like domain
MRSWSSLLLAVPLLGTALLTGADAAAGTQAATALAHPAVATTLWPTYHLDRRRSGNDLGEPSFSHLTSAWNSGALDGAMYAEPLIDGNDVIVATENNSVYAFNVVSGLPAWSPVHLGAPRTAGFPCGNIKPLGITGTPVIDGGFLYVVAEVQTSPTTYEFHLAKVNPSSGAVSYNMNITPTGMDTNVQQERSALAVSAGNVVIVWGGLSGDCGSYHGYVETVSEATGLEQHQWNDTSEPGGSQGGMWAASGPAVNAAGDIFVTTGNGSSTTITNYDFGDSVLKFSPTLVLSSWFAPGPPQSWASLNATDQDLGSIGPSTPGIGLLFAIGKGGRGYLLNQSALPDNSNPGGGENYSNAVCNATMGAAFGGLAFHGNTIFVPCADGIAAVTIDSATAFHRIWYQTSGGGSAAIFAGGLVWTLPMFGGTTLFGLRPGTGQIARTLTLPARTVHFATPAAADSMLFVAAGNRLSAFK